jgi:hypothetical protein
MRSAPIVAVLVGCRLAVWYGAGVGGWIDSPKLFTTFVRLVIFVCSIVIQGLMQDYKESEQMPSELTAAFYGLTSHSLLIPEWAASVCTATVIDGDVEEVETLFMGILRAVEDMGSDTGTSTQDKGHDLYLKAMDAIGNLEARVFSRTMDIEKAGPKGYKLSPPEKQFSRLRYILTRMYVIQKTGYIIEAYVLMDLLVVWIFGVLTATDWPFEFGPHGVPAAAAFTVVITFLFTYIELFVRNLETPFDYPKEHLKRSYEGKKGETLSVLHEQKYGGSIDMAPLTVGYGKLLHRLKAKSKGHSSANKLSDGVVLKALAVRDALAKSEISIVTYEGSDDQVPNSETRRRSWKQHIIQLIRRLRLVIQILPIVTLMVGFRLAVWYGAGMGGWIDPNVPLSFVGVAVFVTSFLQQGVIQDYREAQRILCQVAVALHGIAATIGGGIKQELRPRDTDPNSWPDSVNPYSILEDLLKAALRVLDVQHTAEDNDEYIEAMNDAGSASFGFFTAYVSKSTEPGRKTRKICDASWEIMGAVSDLRRALMRARQIKQESFILDGYTLMDCIVLVVYILLTLADWSRETYYGTAMSATIIISGLFTYMALLIRSLENPYKYPSRFCTSSALESADPSGKLRRQTMDDFTLYDALDCGNSVDPFPLTSLAARFRQGHLRRAYENDKLSLQQEDLLWRLHTLLPNDSIQLPLPVALSFDLAKRRDCDLEIHMVDCGQSEFAAAAMDIGAAELEPSEILPLPARVPTDSILFPMPMPSSFNPAISKDLSIEVLNTGPMAAVPPVRYLVAGPPPLDGSGVPADAAESVCRRRLLQSGYQI